jgi:hypothetical protein
MTGGPFAEQKRLAKRPNADAARAFGCGRCYFVTVNIAHIPAA